MCAFFPASQTLPRPSKQDSARPSRPSCTSSPGWICERRVTGSTGYVGLSSHHFTDSVKECLERNLVVITMIWQIVFYGRGCALDHWSSDSYEPINARWNHDDLTDMKVRKITILTTLGVPASLSMGSQSSPQPTRSSLAHLSAVSADFSSKKAGSGPDSCFLTLDALYVASCVLLNTKHTFKFFLSLTENHQINTDQCSYWLM